MNKKILIYLGSFFAVLIFIQSVHADSIQDIRRKVASDILSSIEQGKEVDADDYVRRSTLLERIARGYANQLKSGQNSENPFRPGADCPSDVPGTAAGADSHEPNPPPPPLTWCTSCIDDGEEPTHPEGETCTPYWIQCVCGVFEAVIPGGSIISMATPFPEEPIYKVIPTIPSGSGDGGGSDDSGDDDSEDPVCDTCGEP